MRESENEHSLRCGGKKHRESRSKWSPRGSNARGDRSWSWLCAGRVRLMQYGSIDLTLEAGDGGELLGLEAGVDTLDGELVGWVHGADADVDQDLALLSMSRVSAMAMAWGRGGRGGGRGGGMPWQRKCRWSRRQCQGWHSQTC